MTIKTEWISVKEQLPEDAKFRLCCVNSETGYMSIFVGYYSSTGHWWLLNAASSIPVAPTHWCDLPAPPEFIEPAMED
jgi:hypothetical protein